MDFRPEDLVPKLARDSKADRTLLVVMKHVVALHVLKIEVLRSRMVDVVVSHIVEDVSEELTRSYTIDHVRWKDPAHGCDHHKEVYEKSRQRRED